MIKRIIILTSILIIVDQTAKILVFYFLYEPHVHINFIDGILSLCPFLNTQSISMGFIAELLNFDISNGVFFNMLMIIAVLLFGLIVLISLYFSFISKKRPGKLVCFLSGFAIAGAICSIIDILFRGGSIDFIMLFDWVIFDLKDIYICTTILLMIFCTVQAVRNLTNFSKEEHKHILSFFKWIKMKCPITQSAL